jgi:cell wall-active antibiotic response 4TMS protein YvqF
MKCAVHSDVDAVGYCRNCGKAMCSTCVRPVRDVLYCEDCLANVIGIPGATPAVASNTAASETFAVSSPPAPARRVGSPGVAFFLGLFPGLGAVYNGEYNKALIHIVVFAAIIVGLSSDPGDGGALTLALLLAGFVLYMAFDAMRTAKAKSLGESTADPLEAWSRNRPVGPIILIALGALFLLNNFDWFPFHFIWRLWPLILIGVGILLFRNRLSNRA